MDVRRNAPYAQTCIVMIVMRSDRDVGPRECGTKAMGSEA